MSSENIQSGRIYKITSVEGGTVLDLSRADNKWVHGYKYQYTNNQKWLLENVDGYWQFCNVATGHYLAIDGTPRNGTRLRAREQPFEWDIRPDEKDRSVYRIYLAKWHTPINVDLSNHAGNPGDPGTPVILWGKWEPGKNQIWRFEQVDGIQSDCIYKITNVKGGTVLDLSRADSNEWVNGCNYQYADNQKWHVENVNGHWQFRNVATGRYLGIDGPRDGARLRAHEYPFRWDIQPDEKDRNVYRICIPGWHTPVNADLSNRGNSDPGTPVILWGKREGRHQTWRFEQV